MGRPLHRRGPRSSFLVSGPPESPAPRLTETETCPAPLRLVRRIITLAICCGISIGTAVPLFPVLSTASLLDASLDEFLRPSAPVGDR